MTKEDAIKAMTEGKKVSHRYFTSDEYVFINAKGFYEFEDGVTISSGEFWMFRAHESYNSDWEIYKG